MANNNKQGRGDYSKASEPARYDRSTVVFGVDILVDTWLVGLLAFNSPLAVLRRSCFCTYQLIYTSMLLNLLITLSVTSFKYDTIPNDTARYYAAIRYVYADPAIKQQIREIAPHQSLFNDTPAIAKKLVFIDFSPFCVPALRNDTCCPSLHLSQEEKDYFGFKRKAGFPTVATDLFDSLYNNESSKLILYFSRPYSNFLTAIITTKMSKNADFELDTFQGLHLKLVFVYDDQGSIKQVCTSILIAN